MSNSADTTHTQIEPKRRNSEDTEETDADPQFGRAVKRRVSLGRPPVDDDEEPQMPLSAVVQAVMEAQQRVISAGHGDMLEAPPNGSMTRPQGLDISDFQSDVSTNLNAGGLSIGPPGSASEPGPGFFHDQLISPRVSNPPMRSNSASNVTSNMRLADVEGLPYGCVIHFTNCRADVDYLRPWKVHSPEVTTGTGFYIGDKRIITNNHVVESGTSIRVTRHGKPGNFEASVLVNSGLCDLALVTVDDDAFWQDLPEARFQNEVPHLDDTVVAVGYPLHATTVTLTRGVVSNVHLKDLTLSGLSERQLCVQIDAAINPGNSGGPVFNQETHEVVGVAFAGALGAQGTGFIIPTAVVKNFLTVYSQTGSFGRLPSLGVTVQNLINKSMRRFAFGITPKHHYGILLQKVQPFSCGKKAGACDGDILMEIDGYKVSEEGEVVFRGHERVGWEYLITKNPIGHKVKVSLLRKNKKSGIADVPVDLEVDLAANFALVPREVGNGFNADYVIAGGLVLLTASVPLLFDCIAERRSKLHTAIISANNKSYLCEHDDTEAVLVADCLAHEINVKYDSLVGQRVESINQVKVRNLRHVAQLVSECTDSFIVFRFTDSLATVAFDTALVKSATPIILTQHKVPSWTSFPGF